MDAKSFLEDFQDHLAGKLDTYEQALYLYCVRHSRLIGQPESVIGFKSARRKMAFGIGKAGTPMSGAVCYEKLRLLEKKGCLALLGTERAGTRIKVLLPAEIPGVLPLPVDATAPSLEETDFFEVAENRSRIFRREGEKCFYCLRRINNDNFVIEHVVSRPVGDNSYRNVVAACLQCNNRKSRSGAEDFLRTLYREALLSASDFEDRISHLESLKEGELKPPAI